MDVGELMLDHVPPTLRRYLVAQPVLDETWSLLRAAGDAGFESTVVWLGSMKDPETAEVLAAVRPRQVAYRTFEGVSVEVPQDALTELISALPARVHVLARIHSHPGGAYHSSLDDTNMLISHEGAVSIVVPDFARGHPNLLDCSVNELLHPAGWRELSREEVGERFVIA
jgi:proteasome lid subunit RPN8/RPN11